MPSNVAVKGKVMPAISETLANKSKAFALLYALRVWINRDFFIVFDCLKDE